MVSISSLSNYHQIVVSCSYRVVFIINYRFIFKFVVIYYQSRINIQTKTIKRKLMITIMNKSGRKRQRTPSATGRRIKPIDFEGRQILFFFCLKCIKHWFLIRNVFMEFEMDWSFAMNSFQSCQTFQTNLVNEFSLNFLDHICKYV